MLKSITHLYHIQDIISEWLAERNRKDGDTFQTSYWSHSHPPKKGSHPNMLSMVSTPNSQTHSVKL